MFANSHLKLFFTNVVILFISKNYTGIFSSKNQLAKGMLEVGQLNIVK
tara:strand:- start:3521 stop:3664 length:144 start_codon:yes stop_codon:yes gene_type:complete